MQTTTESTIRPTSWKWAAAIVVALCVGDWLFQMRPIARHGDLERQRFVSAEYAVDLSLVPGPSARSRVVLTGQALRGDYFARDAYNVVLLGGSTVFCKLLDEEVTLGAQISDAIPPPIRDAIDLRVAAAALPGHRVEHSTENLSKLFGDPDTRPDVVIGKFGADDLGRFFTTAPWPTGAGPEGAHASRNGPFAEPNRSVVFRHRQAASKQGHFIADLRRVYQNHPKLDQLKRFLVPIYRGHLETYERNLNRLIDLAQSEGVGLLLATQPLNFSANDRAGTDQRARSEKFWIAYSAKPEGFVPSPTLIAKLLGDFNDATRRIAATRGVPLVDLASALANCSDCFYDQWHLTVSGSGREGTMIADALLREGLLVRRGTAQR
jgi:hypothetical protein